MVGASTRTFGWAKACLPQTFQNLSEFLPAPAFVVRFIAGCQALQVSDQFVAVGDAVGADLPGNARPQDLLSTAGADLEERLERFAVHPWPRESCSVPR